jgi:uncharacterized protein YdeI (YjbR/CyaY-like superfamily)
METLFDIPIVTFKDSSAWRAWLEDNYTDQTGVWLKIAKKNSGIESVTQPEALDACLCYGWIDGQRRSFDDMYYLQKYTPRRKASLWSKRNIELVASLAEAGLMMPSGLAEVERAKADGRWDRAYDMPSQMVVPDYFMNELDKNPKAKAFFETLNKTNRYAIAWRLQTAKTDETRKKRLDKIITMLETGTFI